MTIADYTAVTPREATPGASSVLFSFYRIRASAADQRFFPEGAKLHFASKAVDTLTVSAPVGFFASGDQVRVEYKGQTVFRGTLERRTKRKGHGTLETETAVFAGPWSAMARLVYRQNWKTSSGYERSSRLILNQYQDGTAQSLNSELTEIVDHGASACGYTRGTINVSTQKLPFDECRDITVADAIRRELRFFPKAVTRFDYSTSTPTLSIVRARSAFAPPEILSRDYSYNEHPITGVDLEIETTGEVNGFVYRTHDHQTAGNTLAGNPDCLYATLQLRGASASNVNQSFSSVTEDLPQNLGDKSWWIQKHPRLAGIAASAIAISNAACDLVLTDQGPFGCRPRISANTAGELAAVGLVAKVGKFTCTCTITGTDDVEENIELTMFFLLTNATTRTYSWTVSSSTSAAETVPSGLAAAILADRSGELEGETLVIRLGDNFPQLGQTLDNLLLQSFDVDCATLEATLNFGIPEHLSIEDMASVLSGFRNKRVASCALSRSSGKPQDDLVGKVELGGIPPISATEFKPGTKSKTKIAATSGTGAINLDASGTKPKLEITDGTKKVLIDLNTWPANCQSGTLGLKSLTYKDSSGTEHTFHGIFCGDIDLRSLAPTTTTVDVLTDVAVTWDISTKKFNLTKTKKTLTVIAAGAASTSTPQLDLDELDVVCLSEYDETTHQFTNKTLPVLVFNKGTGYATSAPIFTATPHSAEVQPAQQGGGE